MRNQQVATLVAGIAIFVSAIGLTPAASAATTTGAREEAYKACSFRVPVDTAAADETKVVLSKRARVKIAKCAKLDLVRTARVVEIPLSDRALRYTAWAVVNEFMRNGCATDWAVAEKKKTNCVSFVEENDTLMSDEAYFINVYAPMP